MWEAFRTTARSARDSTRSYESCLVWSSDWNKEEITTVESCPAWSSDWDKEDIISKRTLKDCYYWIQEVASQQSCCICHCNRRRCTRDMLYAMPLWLQTDAQATCWQCGGDKELALFRYAYLSWITCFMVQQFVLLYDEACVLQFCTLFSMHTIYVVIDCVSEIYPYIHTSIDILILY